MRRKGGVGGTITTVILTLVGIGIFLAILAQFGGNIGELFRWILDIAWGIIISVRDSILSWDIFQNVF